MFHGRMSLLAGCISAFAPLLVAAQGAPALGDHAANKWTETITLSHEFRTFATLDAFLQMSRGGPAGREFVQGLLKTSDVETTAVLAVADVQAQANHAMQKQIYSRMCSEPQNLLTREALGKAFDDMESEIMSSQAQLGTDAARSLDASLSSKLEGVVRGPHGVSRAASRVNAKEWVSSVDKDPREIIQQFCSTVSAMR